MSAIVINHRAQLVDKRTRHPGKKIGRYGAIDATHDGNHVAVRYKNGSVELYNAKSGFYRGRVGKGKASQLDMNGDILTISYEDNTWRMFDVRNRVIMLNKTEANLMKYLHKVNRSSPNHP